MTIPDTTPARTVRRYYHLERWTGVQWEAYVCFDDAKRARKVMTALVNEKKAQGLDVTQSGNLWAWDEALGRVWKPHTQ